MRKTFAILLLVLGCAVVTARLTQAGTLEGTFTFPNNEGTLTWTVSLYSGPCGSTVGYYYGVNGFVYTNAAGTQFPLAGSGYYFMPAQPPMGCPAPGPRPAVIQMSNSFFAINFTEGPGTEGSATITFGGIIYPLYQVTSIIYDPPGNKSSNTYTSSTTDGTTTSVGSSFTQGDSITFSSGGPILSIGYTFATATTTGNSSAFTETYAAATGIGLANSGGSNAINHLTDLFVIWLNAQISFMPTGATTGNYGVETQGSGQFDQVEVEANAMLTNTVPLAILQRQWDAVTGAYDLPGLAHICANQAQYANNCPNGGSCGCVAQDFAPILALDPLLNYSPTENPMNADTSGIEACSAPTPADSCRYVPVPSAPGSSEQEVEWLSGPDYSGGGYIPNIFTQTDSNQTTQTLSESQSESTAYTVKVAWPAGGPSLASTTTWTWTNSESTGAINGKANSMAVTFESSTVDCYEEIPIFEDTVFHTFVYMQPTGNSSCP